MEFPDGNDLDEITENRDIEHCVGNIAADIRQDYHNEQDNNGDPADSRPEPAFLLFDTTEIFNGFV